MNRPCAGALLTAAFFLVVGCSAPYKEPRVESRPPGQTEFPGIAQLAAQTPGRSIDVLMVHGMCTHGQQWAKTSINRLSSMLGGPKEPLISQEPVPETKTILHRAELQTPHGSIRASAVVWSPVVAPLKAQLCYDQTNKSESCKALDTDSPPYPYARASLNRGLKDELLNDCLADAIIYQGKSRDAISAQLQRAILVAATTGGSKLAKSSVERAAAQEATPIAFISESLGSKVAFDAIYMLQTSGDADERAAGVRTFDRFAQVYMGANQLPILSLADQDVGNETKMRAATKYPADPLGALLNDRKARSLLVAREPLQVVAFTDPNDLLSYALSRAKPVVSFDVIDVIVSNDWTYFEFLERPDTAHTGYRTNDSVMRLIACGTKGCP